MCKMLRSTQSISPVCLCVALFVHGNLRCYKGKTSNAAPPWGQPVTALYNTTHLAPTTHTSAIHIRKRHAADNVHTQCLFIYMKVHPNSCELCKLPPSLEQHTHTYTQHTPLSADTATTTRKRTYKEKTQSDGDPIFVYTRNKRRTLFSERRWWCFFGSYLKIKAD